MPSNDLQIIEDAMRSPTLLELLEELRGKVKAEAALRQKFYRDITPEHKWEFINGEVLMHSPALNRHTLAMQHLYKLLDAHVLSNALGQVRVEKAMCTFPRNDYEPDIVFFGTEKAAQLEPDTLRFPTPDLVVEVLSPSTEKTERGIKFDDYFAHGVSEYWIVDPVQESVEIYRPGRRSYELAETSDDTLISATAEGFQIPVRAVFDPAENLRVLRGLLA